MPSRWSGLEIYRDAMRVRMSFLEFFSHSREIRGTLKLNRTTVRLHIQFPKNLPAIPCPFLAGIL
jgi:hypothetical protein